MIEVTSVLLSFAHDRVNKKWKALGFVADKKHKMSYLNGPSFSHLGLWHLILHDYKLSDIKSRQFFKNCIWNSTVLSPLLWGGCMWHFSKQNLTVADKDNVMWQLFSNFLLRLILDLMQPSYETLISSRLKTLT